MLVTILVTPSENVSQNVSHTLSENGSPIVINTLQMLVTYSKMLVPILLTPSEMLVTILVTPFKSVSHNVSHTL